MTTAEEPPTKRPPEALTAERKDLMSIREAANVTGVPDTTIRSWIFTGKAGRKMPTYRARGDMNTIMVSRTLVEQWASTKPRAPRKLADRVADGSVKSGHVQLNLETATKLIELEGLMQKRLGMPLTHSFVLSTALDSALRLERARAPRDGA